MTALTHIDICKFYDFLPYIHTVKPRPVRNLVVVPINSTALAVTWDPPEGIMEFAELNYTVHYLSQYGDEDVVSISC